MTEGKDIQRWADSAMYVAEPIDQGSGPRVFLIEATPDPLGSIAAAASLYEGAVRRSKADATHEERQRYLAELQKTKIKAPLEFVQFHFLLEGVTRGFTHQLVRQRTATFVQESTRFAVKEDMPVGLPPSLAGTTAVWRQHEQQIGVSVDPEHCSQCDLEVKRLVGERMVRESEAERQRWSWDLVQERIGSGYQYLVNSGMPAEDARGLLPTNLLTRVHYSTDLRALLDHAGNRLCTQAQFEWRLVFAKMAEAIRSYRPLKALADQMHLDRGVERLMLENFDMADAWQWEAIADLLRPICYATGKCEFNSSMDRACSIRDRVNAFHDENVPSSQWGPDGCTVEQPCVHSELNLEVIQPREWLADPGAAR